MSCQNYFFLDLRCSYFTHSRIVSLYRRLGTNYRFHSRVKGYHLQGSSSPMFFLDPWTLEDGTDMLPRNVGTELPFYVA